MVITYGMRQSQFLQKPWAMHVYPWANLPDPSTSCKEPKCSVNKVCYEQCFLWLSESKLQPILVSGSAILWMALVLATYRTPVIQFLFQLQDIHYFDFKKMLKRNSTRYTCFILSNCCIFEIQEKQNCDIFL